MEIILLALFLIIPLLIGIPIAFALGIAGLLGIMVFMNPSQFTQMINIIFNHGTSSTLIVAPLFILMAEILNVSGISRDLFDASHKWFSRIPGGLAVTSVVTSAGFSSISGSSAATVATIGSISMPEMLKRNYSKRLSSGAVVAGGTLGILIPPSLALIIYGVITESSIVKLFLGAIVPGVLVTILLCAVIIIYAMAVPSSAGGTVGEKFTWYEKLSSVRKTLPVVFLSGMILISMYSGIATPTEAASLGVLFAFVIVLFMKRLNWSLLKEALLKSVKTSTMIMFLVFGGLIYTFVIAYLNIPDAITELILQVGAGPWVTMSLIIFMLIILGCFLEPLSMLMITMPILFPVITQMGFDPIWFGVIVTLIAEIGMITPPVGLNLFVLKATNPELDLENDIIKGSLPFIGVLLAAILILCIEPRLVTFMGG